MGDKPTKLIEVEYSDSCCPYCGYDGLWGQESWDELKDVRADLCATKAVVEALHQLVKAVENMKVPQTTEDAAMQVLFTLGPQLKSAQNVLAAIKSTDGGGK